jgi:hypothetical protein
MYDVLCVKVQHGSCHISSSRHQASSVVLPIGAAEATPGQYVLQCAHVTQLQHQAHLHKDRDRGESAGSVSGESLRFCHTEGICFTSALLGTSAGTVLNCLCPAGSVIQHTTACMSLSSFLSLPAALCQQRCLQAAPTVAPPTSQPWLSISDVDPVAKESRLLVGPVPPSMMLSCGCMASTCHKHEAARVVSGTT